MRQLSLGGRIRGGEYTVDWVFTISKRVRCNINRVLQSVYCNGPHFKGLGHKMDWTFC
jgi:hypothetical protein